MSLSFKTDLKILTALKAILYNGLFYHLISFEDHKALPVMLKREACHLFLSVFLSKYHA